MHDSPFICRWLIAARWPLLAVACVCALSAWPLAHRVAFDRSIENMYAADDPLLAGYRKLKEHFGKSEIVMAVYVDPELLAAHGAGIRRLSEVDATLRGIAGVQDVLSLRAVNEALKYTQMLKLLLSPDRPPIADPTNRFAAAYRAMFEGVTHDATGRIAALVVMLEPERTAAVSRRETIDRIRATMEKLPEGRIAGEPVMVIDGFRYVEQDGKRLGWATTILLVLAIAACFRSLRWVLIPVLVVQLALVLTRASLVMVGLRLSMVSSMLTAIVTVVGVATVVHIIVRVREATAGGLSPRAALLEAGSRLTVPVFWACATDAAGFLSLTVAKVGPVRDFGIMTAIACAAVLLSVVLLVPGLALLGRFDSGPRPNLGDKRLGLELDRLARAAERSPRRWLIALVLLFAASAVGLLRLEVETDFTRNFRRDSPVAASYRFIEEHLGGAGVWDVLLPSPRRLDEGYADRVREFERQLRALTVRDASGAEVPALTKVLSLVDGIDAAGINPLLAHLPPELKARGMAITMPHFVAALRTDNRRPGDVNYLRIMLRAREQQPAARKAWVIAEVERLAESHFPPSGDSEGAEVTGFYVLLTNLITSVLRDQWICFLVAALSVGLMMAFCFRSVSLAVIALVPNALPVFVLLGAMGWLGIRVNMGAAMIAAVSMGLSVDSSIHYITSFRRARAAGRTVAGALHEVQQTVGRAVVYSTVALVVGFLALCGSHFIPTIYFGGLVSLAMVGGLIGNLIVLPLLLNAFVRD
ncbi:MAG: RND family transporter [Planctomycetes bacterium]|nr:RND family transporter [Planctomycetota bacterium]